jgi:hypothetical protein
MANVPLFKSIEYFQTYRYVYMKKVKEVLLDIV